MASESKDISQGSEVGSRQPADGGMFSKGLFFVLLSTFAVVLVSSITEIETRLSLVRTLEASTDEERMTRSDDIAYGQAAYSSVRHTSSGAQAAAESREPFNAGLQAIVAIRRVFGASPNAQASECARYACDRGDCNYYSEIYYEGYDDGYASGSSIQTFGTPTNATGSQNVSTGFQNGASIPTAPTPVRSIPIEFSWNGSISYLNDFLGIAYMLQFAEGGKAPAQDAVGDIPSFLMELSDLGGMATTICTDAISEGSGSEEQSDQSEAGNYDEQDRALETLGNRFRAIFAGLGPQLEIQAAQGRYACSGRFGPEPMCRFELKGSLLDGALRLLEFGEERRFYPVSSALCETEGSSDEVVRPDQREPDRPAFEPRGVGPNTPSEIRETKRCGGWLGCVVDSRSAILCQLDELDRGERSCSPTYFVAFVSRPVASMPLVWLIALVVCCAAAVGGATSELRSGRSVTHDSTLAMLAAFFGGIVVLLCLKGGTGVLFDHNDALDVRVNHYGAALAGVLAGLFSRRFYHLLEHTVDEAMTRLTRPNDTPPKCTRVCPMAAGASTDTQQPAEISDQQKASKAP